MLSFVPLLWKLQLSPTQNSASKISLLESLLWLCSTALETVTAQATAPTPVKNLAVLELTVRTQKHYHALLLLQLRRGQPIAATQPPVYYKNERQRMAKLCSTFLAFFNRLDKFPSSLVCQEPNTWLGYFMTTWARYALTPCLFTLMSKQCFTSFKMHLWGTLWSNSHFHPYLHMYLFPTYLVN